MFLLVLVFSLSFSLSDSPCHACCFLMQFALHIYLFSYCADYHSADLIINSSSSPPPFPSCHCFPLNLIFLLVYLLPSSHLFSFAPRVALRSPPLIWAPAVSHLSLWFTSSLFHFHLSLLSPPGLLPTRSATKSWRSTARAPRAWSTREPSSSSRMEAGESIWCSRGVTALCLNMVGQSTKTFPSRPSSHPEPGDTQADGGGLKVKELNRSPSPRILHPSLEQTYQGWERGVRGVGGVASRFWSLCGGGHSWAFLGFRGRARGSRLLLWVLSPPPAVTCSQFCHVISLSLFTFWALSKSTLLGLNRKVVGLIFSATWGKKKKKGNCLQGLTWVVKKKERKSMFLVGEK